MATATAPAPVRTVRTAHGAVVIFDDGYPFEFVGGFGPGYDFAAAATEHRAEARARINHGSYTLSEHGPHGDRTVPDSERYDNRDDAEVAAHRRKVATGLETWSTFGEVESYYEPSDY